MVEDPSGSTEYQTRPAKFQGVASLTLHFPANYGADRTRIWRVISPPCAALPGLLLSLALGAGKGGVRWDGGAGREHHLTRSFLRAARYVGLRGEGTKIARDGPKNLVRAAQTPRLLLCPAPCRPPRWIKRLRAQGNCRLSLQRGTEVEEARARLFQDGRNTELIVRVVRAQVYEAKPQISDHKAPSEEAMPKFLQ